MKPSLVSSVTLGLLITFSLLFGSFLAPHRSWAENGDEADKYSREELAQMLAPIALYPDTLLSQVLMASTYPIEIVEADRWVKNNPELKDEALDDALLDQDWDPSVKAVCHFPTVLAMMSDRIGETTNIGNAFLAQETEVMDTVQELRAKAHARDNLTSNNEQKVIMDNDTIIIEPADPRVIYVPYYDPSYVYGPWWYPAYPPYYWIPPGVSVGIGISFWPGIYFGFSFGNWSYFDWYHHYIHIDIHNRPRFVRHDHWITSGRWEHVPVHRRGVAYPNRTTAVRFGQPPSRPTDFHRASRKTQSLEMQRSIDQRQRNDFDRQMRERSEIKGGPGSRNDRNRSPQPRKIESVQPQTKTTEPDKTQRQGGDRKIRQDDLSRKSQQDKKRGDSFQPQTTPGAVEQQQNLDRTKDNRTRRQRIDPGASTSGQTESNRRQAVGTEPDRQNVRQFERSRQRSVDLEQQLGNQATTEGRAVGEAQSPQTQSPQGRDRSFGRFDSGQTTRSWSNRGRSNGQRTPQSSEDGDDSDRGRGRR